MASYASVGDPDYREPGAMMVSPRGSLRTQPSELPPAFKRRFLLATAHRQHRPAEGTQTASRLLLEFLTDRQRQTAPRDPPGSGQGDLQWPWGARLESAGLPCVAVAFVVRLRPSGRF